MPAHLLRILTRNTFSQNLAKLTGSAVRINSKKPKGKKTMKEKKKNWKMPRRDLNPHSNFLRRKKCGHRALTTGPCDHSAIFYQKLTVLKYLFLPFTLFEPYGAAFIINSKMHLRKNSSKEYFKTILHYRLVYSLSGFI